jgi:hypothetical protein
MSNVIAKFTNMNGLISGFESTLAVSQTVVPHAFVVTAISPGTSALSLPLTGLIHGTSVLSWIKSTMSMSSNHLLVSNSLHRGSHQCNYLACSWINHHLGWDEIHNLSLSCDSLRILNNLVIFCFHTCDDTSDLKFFVISHSISVT